MIDDKLKEILQLYHLTSFVTPEEALKTLEELRGSASPETMVAVDEIKLMFKAKLLEAVPKKIALPKSGNLDREGWQAFDRAVTQNQVCDQFTEAITRLFDE